MPNRPRLPNEHGELPCGGCRQWLPQDSFPRKASVKSGRDSRCRACIAERQRLAREARKPEPADPLARCRALAKRKKHNFF